VVRDAQSKASFGKLLSNDELVEMGDETLRRRHLGEPFHPERRRRGRGWLGRRLGDRLGCAGAADVNEGVDAALVEREVRSQAEIAGPGLAGNGDTENLDLPDQPTVGGRTPLSVVSGRRSGSSNFLRARPGAESVA